MKAISIEMWTAGAADAQSEYGAGQHSGTPGSKKSFGSSINRIRGQRGMQPVPMLTQTQKRLASTHNEEADSLNKNDYLANLGKAQDYNINVDHDQSSNNIDHLFTGKTLGAKSDIADCTLRGA
ncbi:hypothetical protein WJX84_000265 [Apatococcus fuscideae]|uniref:Uncharacterized protein n=1 Tax=Apatococcus fuscideae TaxID=2026836 RepID=A0AAW1T861_9CHLO